jgi:hypothetical protein
MHIPVETSVATPPGAVLGSPGELLEVERVAAALLVEDRCFGGGGAAEKLANLIGRQGAELDPGQLSLALRSPRTRLPVVPASGGDAQPAR